MTGSIQIPIFLILFSLTPSLRCSEVRAEGKILKFKGITADVTKRRIEVKGNISLESGLIEYYACVSGGKEHETLIMLDCKPEDLYVASQSLGLSPGKGVEFQGARTAPTGDKVYLLIEWKADGKKKSYRAEDLVWDVQKKAPMQRTHWIFVGSKFEKITESGKPILMASLQKNIIATFHDPYVLFDHPLESGADDTIYEANAELTPKAGTAVRLVILKDKPVE